jgi:hypothetical protein
MPTLRIQVNSADLDPPSADTKPPILRFSQNKLASNRSLFDFLPEQLMLTRIRSALRNFLRRPISDWGLLAEAITILIWSKIRLYTTLFAVLAKELGSPQAETLRQIPETHRALASKISWAVQTGARYSPLRLVCLPQAMAANTMLSRRKIDSTLYLGVKLDQADALTAHAWLRAGVKWVTGGAARHGQSVVACFAKTGPSPSSVAKKIRIVIAVGVLTAVTILSLMPLPPLSDLTWPDQTDSVRRLINTVGAQDYWFNFVGFSVAGLLFNFALYGANRAPFRYRWLAGLVFVSGIVILECVQFVLPRRSFDLMDIAAGLTAISVVSLLWIRPSIRA